MRTAFGHSNPHSAASLNKIYRSLNGVRNVKGSCTHDSALKGQFIQEARSRYTVGKRKVIPVRTNKGLVCVCRTMANTQK